MLTSLIPILGLIILTLDFGVQVHGEQLYHFGPLLMRISLYRNDFAPVGAPYRFGCNI